MLADHLAPGATLALADLEAEDGSFHGPQAEVHRGFDRAVIRNWMTANGLRDLRESTPWIMRRDVAGEPQGISGLSDHRPAVIPTPPAALSLGPRRMGGSYVRADGASSSWRWCGSIRNPATRRDSWSTFWARSRLSAGAAASTTTATSSRASRPSGCEGVEPILLSCHGDTVKPGVGIEPVLVDGVIRSKGDTILGADDKAGIAEVLEALRVAPDPAARSSSP